MASGVEVPADVAPRIPAYVNAAAGTAAPALETLRAEASCTVHETAPEALEAALREALDGGAARVLVAGGDGTIATAARVLAESETALVVVPAGTLNHFAKDHGIPVDHADAARLASGGRVVTADLASVNGVTFLNTSSVGAYVLFVRRRERLERRFGYRVASVLAALRTLPRIRPFTVELDVEGASRRYRTALVFIGVGEREVQVPVLGGRVADGRHALHVIVVRGGSWLHLLRTGLALVARGMRDVSRTSLLDSFLVDRCRIEMRRSRGMVAVDGELVEMHAPLAYALRRGALRIVVPEPSEARDPQ